MNRNLNHCSLLQTFALLASLVTVQTAEFTNRPGIAGHFIEMPAQLDLGAEGASDWLRFGWEGQPVLTRKPGADLIVLELPPAAALRGLPANGSHFTGNQNLSRIATNDLACTGDGNGFVITAPADRRNRTLRLYVAAKGAWAELVATATGGGVGWYADTTLKSSGITTSRCYVINYTAPREGERLRIEFRVLQKNTPGGQVALQAATLQTFERNEPPVVRITSPKPKDEGRAPAQFVCEAEASDADGRVARVEFYAWSTALKLGVATNAPFRITAKPAFEVGRFAIIARAYDDRGCATDSEPVWFTVNDDVKYPPRAKPRRERFISTHVAGSGHEGIPNLLEMPNSDLLCAFYAGKYELAADTSVFLTRLRAGASDWEPPRRIIGGDNVSKANPVLMLGDDGTLWCFYVNVEGNAFEYSRLCYRQSRDGGATWGKEVRMPQPKFRYPTGTIGALKPLHLRDGTILLPLNREAYDPDPKRGWFSLFMRSTDGGRSWTESAPLFAMPGNIQPTAQQLDDGSLLAFFRPRGRGNKLWRSTSSDGGASWAPLEKTTLDNPSSRSDFVLLPDGKVVLACNHAPQKRSPVNLLLSEDLGKTWKVDRAIETGPGPYGYCAVIRTRDGNIHIAYDCDRRVIKHVVVDEAWFDEPLQSVEYQRP